MKQKSLRQLARRLIQPTTNEDVIDLYVGVGKDGQTVESKGLTSEETHDAQIYVVFSEDFYQEFSTTEEFIDWMYRL